MTSYLSLQTQNEFISLFGEWVPHVDQMSRIISYVHIKWQKFKVRIIEFFPFAQKDAKKIKNDVLQILEKDN